jgi:hypothetical protein
MTRRSRSPNPQARAARGCCRMWMEYFGEGGFGIVRLGAEERRPDMGIERGGCV